MANFWELLSDESAWVHQEGLLKRCWHVRAQKEKQYDAAIEHYGKAISSSGQAPPKFAAILSANRAAAFQAKGLHAEAISDALRATALDPTYTKARVMMT